ncbi:MAG: BatA domain-containing protein [Candidatus Thermochlorobacter sp.]
MLELLSPLSLMALASLAVPIIIHLLSQREPRLIKVGTIKFLKATQTPTFRRTALSEWWLLLLRALLLLMATLALSQPILRTHSSKSAAQGWALVSPDVWQRTTDVQTYTLIDSLRAAGYELRLLAKNFPPLPKDSVENQLVNAWSMLEELDNMLPEETQLALLTSERLALLHGQRPTLARAVRWYTVANLDRIEQVLTAKQVGQDSVLALAVESQREGTHFQRKLMHTLDAAQQRIAIAPLSPPKRIAIFFDDAMQRDANYLRYALQAVKEKFFANLQLTLLPSHDTAAQAAPPDMLFWFSERDIPKWLDTTRFILRYAQGARSDTPSTVTRPDGESFLLKRRLVAPSHHSTIWSDGFGNPILTQQRIAHLATSLSNEYVFYSRFSPEWNNLVLSPSFPEWIAALVLDEHQLNVPDLRAATALQHQPQYDSAHASHTHKSEPEAMTPLHLPLWIFVAILFIIERMVSHRRTRAAKTP